MKKLSQFDLIKEFFTNNPNRDISHPEVVDWLTAEWEKRTGEKFRDPDRGIRSLAQEGFLIKIAKGVYRYDPEHMANRELEDFTESQKQEILELGDYRCAVCGKGREDGIELQVDHIKPKDFGGKATIENGQVLCAKHNYLKKNLGQTTTGKKIFINLYKLAKKENNQELIKFTSDVLKVFEKHNMNGHIEWEK